MWELMQSFSSIEVIFIYIFASILIFIFFYSILLMVKKVKWIVKNTSFLYHKNNKKWKK